MNDTDKIKAIAELDGYKPTLAHQYGGKWIEESWPSYLTSYDAIIPLIQKCCDGIVCSWYSLKEELYKLTRWRPDYISTLKATPTQLADALLHATGKWKD